LSVSIFFYNFFIISCQFQLICFLQKKIEKVSFNLYRTRAHGHLYNINISANWIFKVRCYNFRRTYFRGEIFYQCFMFVKLLELVSSVNAFVNELIYHPLRYVLVHGVLQDPFLHQGGYLLHNCFFFLVA
jgi:hypothetical protein